MKMQASRGVPQVHSTIIGRRSQGRRLLWLGIRFGALAGALAGPILMLALQVALLALGKTSFQAVLLQMILLGPFSLLGAIFGAFLGLSIGLHRIIFPRNNPHPLVWALLAGLGSTIPSAIFSAYFDNAPERFLEIAAISSMSALSAGLTALWLAHFAPRSSISDPRRLRTTVLSMGAGHLLMAWQPSAMLAALTLLYILVGGQ